MYEYKKVANVNVHVKVDENSHEHFHTAECRRAGPPRQCLWMGTGAAEGSELPSFPSTVLFASHPLTCGLTSIPNPPGATLMC